MSSMKVVPLALAMLAAGWVTSYGQPFVSGSTGNDGALTIAGSLGTVTVGTDVAVESDFDGDSVYHFTTISIGSGTTVLFPQNDLNSPIILLAMGDVTISGTISVNGTSGSAGAGGVGGPGGFDGGFAGGTDFPPGDGFGPGHGKRGDITRASSVDRPAGNAGYGTRESTPDASDGPTYGSPLLVPMVGGSGGGGGEGQPGTGGGGGGGAILIASTTRIQLNSTGRINALGGSGAGGAGSGGAIRLVAPVIEGSGRLNTDGGLGASVRAGDGRVRVDAIDRTNMSFSFDNTTQAIGSFMAVFPSTVPRLDIIEVAGTAIEVAASSVVLQLPFGSTSNRNVVVQGTDFLGDVDIRLVVTPESGDSATYDDTITTDSVTVQVIIPVNTVAHIAVWTR